jgi:creatinine amidohydrolase
MRTCVVPLGAIEQHGPHLPLDVDATIADALGERFCARVPGTLQAPVIAFGCSSEHLAFPGTLSVSPETLTLVLGDLLASLAAHGFERLVVFSAHGGNDAPLAAAEARLRQRAAPARLTVIRGIERIAEVWQAASAREGIPARASGHHAGEYETSIVASLAPSSVRWSELHPGADGEVPDPQRLFYPSLRPHAPEGVLGDPSLASGERGERYLSAWLDLLVADHGL